MNRLQARLTARTVPTTGFTSQPEPRTIGSVPRGRQLTAGSFQFAGHLVKARGVMIWDLEMPSPRFEEELHGFGWLDDLAAVGSTSARNLAQKWLFEWIKRYGYGHGPGWTPELTGRRLIRWINNAVLVLSAEYKQASGTYFRTISHQTAFLSRRWKAAAPGLPRFEALAGLTYAGLALNGMERHVKPAMRGLARECNEQIDGGGGIPTRNPEELLEIFTLLIWAASALSEAGQMARREHLEAIERIAPVLRAISHGDGALGRFHGGGRGKEGRLDQALAASGVRAIPRSGLSMGYARLSAGRTTLLVDAAKPPVRRASYNGHASTLAFELTSGRRPVIVNCGEGAQFGREWQRAGRATPSHSTLGIDSYSSSSLAEGSRLAGGNRELLLATPKSVDVRQVKEKDGIRFQGGHNGYAPSHGLIHLRQLDLSFDGRTLLGEDTLVADKNSHKHRFDKLLAAGMLQGIPYAIRLHLHPDVEAELDMGGAAVSLVLKSGEVWVFRHGGGAALSLEPSIYLQKNRLRPRATKQIILSAHAMEYVGKITWSLAKAQDTPSALRDLARDEDEILN